MPAFAPCRLTAALTLVSLLAATLQAVAQDDFARQRRDLAHRTRRIILNNDGCDVLYYPRDKPVTVAAVLAQRTTPLVGTQVDTIFYCPISSGFSNFTYNTRLGTVLDRNIGEDRNVTRDLINQGTDALKMVLDFAHANKLEAFCSMRMNDTHDAAHTPDKPYPLFPPLKVAHPDWLMGRYDARTKYGPWSGVDYTRPEVRNLALAYLQEICQNYDVDGIELDFLRHLSYFKSVAEGGTASDAERDMMTDLMRRVRAMADQQGRRRGRPVLVAIRVPDSVEYSRAVGLDIERWLSEGLVDLLSATCYYQLNPWETIITLGHKYGVPVYPCLSDSRVKGKSLPYSRDGQLTYRARAAEAWQAGADGIYLFNYFNPKGAMLGEIGDPQALRTLDKTYFVTTRNYKPSMYLAGGEKLQTVPVLTPDDPWQLSEGKPVTVPLRLGQEAAEKAAAVKLGVMCPAPVAPHVALNGTGLGTGKRAGAWWEYAVAPTVLRPGRNEISVAAAPAGAAAEAWEVQWEGAGKPEAPWSVDRLGANTLAEGRDGALLVADRGTASGEYAYFSYAWNASPEREAVAEVQARVVSGINSIIFSNGAHCSRVMLKPGCVHWYGDEKSAYALDTTGGFHTYRLTLVGESMKLAVDDKPALEGRLTAAAPDGRNALQFGAASSTEVGECLWKSVRFRTGATSLFDVVLSVDYP